MRFLLACVTAACDMDSAVVTPQSRGMGSEGNGVGRRLLAWLRDAAWLNPQRARAYAVLLLVGQVAILASIVPRDGIVDAIGRPIGTDFASFWTASSLALEGRPEAVWNRDIHHGLQQQAFSPATPYYAFFYPPTFLLLCLPLALLPYPLALLVWLGGTFTAWFRGIRAILPQGWAILPMAAFPAVWGNAAHGQNAFLTAALFGGAALALSRHPGRAGLCIGLLAIKPHLAVVIPLALAVTRRWGAFTAAAVTVLGFAGLATLVLGTESWRAFHALSDLARRTLEESLVEPEKMASVFAAVRVLGGGVTLAYLAQAVVAVPVLAILLPMLRHRPGGLAEMTAVAAATPLVSPFLLDYDLMLLGLPLAWVMAAAQRDGFLPWEKLGLLAAFLTPFIARPAAFGLGVPLAPVGTAILLALVLRRLARERGEPAAP